jgi:hypothetical protein
MIVEPTEIVQPMHLVEDWRSLLVLSRGYYSMTVKVTEAVQLMKQLLKPV